MDKELKDALERLREEIAGLRREMEEIKRERIVVVPYPTPCPTTPYQPYDPYRPSVTWF